MKRKTTSHSINKSLALSARLLLLVCLFAGGTALAQPLRFGVMAGYLRSNPTDFDARSGLAIGLKATHHFADNAAGAYLDLGLTLAAKGWTTDEIYAMNDADSHHWKCRATYLQVPVHAGYKWILGERTAFFADAGPYVAVGLCGKSRMAGVDADEFPTIVSDKIFSDDLYQRFDCGAGVRIGVEFNGHSQLMVGYDVSFVNAAKGEWKYFNLKDRTLSVAYAYVF